MKTEICLFKTLVHWLRLCGGDNKNQLKKAKHHVINQSTRVLLLPLKGPRHRIKGPDA